MLATVCFALHAAHVSAESQTTLDAAKAPGGDVLNLTIELTSPLQIAASTDNGKHGEVVLLTGEGFTPGGLWKAYLNRELVVKGAVDENGLIERNGEVAAFRVPEIRPGKYTLTVLDWETRKRASMSFEVIPEIHRLLVKATNGTHRLRVRFMLDDIQYRTTEDMSVDEGLHLFTVSNKVFKRGSLYYFDHWEDGTGATVSLASSFKYDVQAKTLLQAVFVSYKPRVIITTGKAPVGDVLTVRGSGYPSGLAFSAGCVTIYKTGVEPINCTYLGDPVKHVQSDGTFKFGIVIPQVPETGVYTVRVANLTYSAEADFNVKYIALFKIHPSIGAQGSYVNFYGRGFPMINNAEVELFIKYGESEDKFDEAYTDRMGIIEGSFMIPAYADGDYIIVAKASGHNINAQADLTIEWTTPLQIAASTDKGKQGEVVLLTGEGFTPGGLWKAYLSRELLIHGTVDENGLIERNGHVAAFRVPELPPGNYTLTVLDWETRKKVSMGFEVVPEMYRLLVKATNGTRRLAVRFMLDDVMYRTTEDMRASEGLHLFTVPNKVFKRGAFYSFDHWEDGTGATVSLTSSFQYDLQAKTLLQAVFVKTEPE